MLLVMTAATSLSIGAVARRVGISVQAVRYYERIGLLPRAGPCKAVRSRAEAKLQTIERKLAELKELRDAVAALAHACSGDRAVEHCSILAALSGQTKGNEPWQRHRQRPPVAPRRASRARKRASGASKTA